MTVADTLTEALVELRAAVASAEMIPRLNVYDEIPTSPKSPYVLVTHFGGSMTVDSWTLKAIGYVRGDMPDGQQTHAAMVDAIEDALADDYETSATFAIIPADVNNPATFIADFTVTVTKPGLGPR